MSRVMGAALLSALAVPSGVFDFPTSLIVSGDLALEAFYRLDAGKYTQSGGLISEFADHTTHARHAAQSNDPQKATYDDTTYSRPCASFFAGQEYEIAAALAAAMAVDKQHWTLWCYRKLATTVGNQATIAIGSLGGMAETVESGNRCIRHQGQTLVTDGAANTTGTLVVCQRDGTENDHMSVNGVEVALSASGGQGTPSDVSFIGALLSALFLLDGDLFEIGVASRVFSGGAPGVGNPNTGELLTLWDYIQAWYA